MLVLSRKIGERIVLPDQHITLTVLEVRGEQVRLGIDAPKDMPVYRQEIWDRMCQFDENPAHALVTAQ